jgi:hypothetical protein
LLFFIHNLIKKTLFFLLSFALPVLAFAEKNEPFAQNVKPIVDANAIKDTNKKALVSMSISFDSSFRPFLKKSRQVFLHLYSPAQKKVYRLLVHGSKKTNIWAIPKDTYRFSSIQAVLLNNNRLEWNLNSTSNSPTPPVPQSLLRLSSDPYINLGAWALGLDKKNILWLRPIKSNRFDQKIVLSAKKTPTPNSKTPIRPLIAKSQPMQESSIKQRPRAAIDISNMQGTPRLAQLEIDYTRNRQIYMAYRISIKNQFNLSNKLTKYIERFDAQFRRCYLRTLDIDATTSGHMIFAFTLSSNPIVIGRPTLRSSSIRQRSLTKCLANELQGLALPLGAGQTAYIIFQMDAK